ncbi:MAG TPA: hypothetical protein VHL11_07820 [Phototrophicaceae bacterium]|jgi:hypothetical protein|nr:hypothetical protein [Phototrophicaceae bacterium]
MMSLLVWMAGFSSGSQAWRDENCEIPVDGEVDWKGELVFASRTDLLLISKEGFQSFPLDLEEDQNFDIYQAFLSPDNKYIAAKAYNHSDDEVTKLVLYNLEGEIVHVWDLDGRDFAGWNGDEQILISPYPDPPFMYPTTFLNIYTGQMTTPFEDRNDLPPVSEMLDYTNRGSSTHWGQWREVFSPNQKYVFYYAETLPSEQFSMDLTLVDFERRQVIWQRNNPFGLPNYPEWSPTSDAVVYEIFAPENNIPELEKLEIYAEKLLMVTTSGVEITLGAGVQQGWTTQWSSDGNKVAFYANGLDMSRLIETDPVSKMIDFVPIKLYVFDTSELPHTSLLQCVQASGSAFRWNPEGNQVVMINPPIILDLVTGNQESIPLPDDSQFFQLIGWIKDNQ